MARKILNEDLIIDPRDREGYSAPEGKLRAFSEKIMGGFLEMETEEALHSYRMSEATLEMIAAEEPLFRQDLVDDAIQLLSRSDDLHVQWMDRAVRQLVQGLYVLGHNDFIIDYTPIRHVKSMGHYLCGQEERPLRVHYLAERYPNSAAGSYAKHCSMAIRGSFTMVGAKSQRSSFHMAADSLPFAIGYKAQESQYYLTEIQGVDHWVTFPNDAPHVHRLYLETGNNVKQITLLTDFFEKGNQIFIADRNDSCEEVRLG